MAAITGAGSFGGALQGATAEVLLAAASILFCVRGELARAKGEAESIRIRGEALKLTPACMGTSYLCDPRSLRVLEVSLKKAGNSYKGLCPFHGEKTPSFTVTPARESWKCFGCGRGGDLFNFVMERDSIDFSRRYFPPSAS